MNAFCVSEKLKLSWIIMCIIVISGKIHYLSADIFNPSIVQTNYLHWDATFKVEHTQNDCLDLNPTMFAEEL